MSLCIRAAGPLDRHALEGLCADLLREHQTRYPEIYPHLPPDAAAAVYAAEWARKLEGDPTCLVWLAIDRAPVGFLAAELWTRPIGQPTAVCFGEWFYVSPDARGQGIVLRSPPACQRVQRGHHARRCRRWPATGSGSARWTKAAAGCARLISSGSTSSGRRALRWLHVNDAEGEP
jgi:GNAT superfamily N-acetyltransferase